MRGMSGSSDSKEHRSRPSISSAALAFVPSSLTFIRFSVPSYNVGFGKPDHQGDLNPKSEHFS
jgi:hypothetical protein